METTHDIYLLDNKYLSLLTDESIHLIATSPPYVTTEYKKGQEFDYDGFLQHFADVCHQLFRVTVEGGRFALNVAHMLTKYRYPEEDLMTRVPFSSDMLQIALKTGFRLLERFIWDKGFTRNFGGPLLGTYPYPLTVFNNNYFEYIFILRKPGKRKVTSEIREKSKFTLKEWKQWTQEWWRIESESEKFKLHGAIFPLEIPLRLIRMYSYVGDIILDPYMGSGATMLAAHRCQRNSIGFEIDQKCEGVILKRADDVIMPLLEKKPNIHFIHEGEICKQMASGQV